MSPTIEFGKYTALCVYLCVTCPYKHYREELRKERAKRLGEASGSHSSSKSRDSKKMKKKVFFFVFVIQECLRTNMGGGRACVTTMGGSIQASKVSKNRMSSHVHTPKFSARDTFPSA